jgi:hypothetical protein
MYQHEYYWVIQHCNPHLAICHISVASVTAESQVVFSLSLPSYSSNYPDHCLNPTIQMIQGSYSIVEYYRGTGPTSDLPLAL